MMIPLQRAGERPVPAPYVVAAAAASLVVFVCFSTAHWYPWFVEQMTIYPISFVSVFFAVLALPACWLAFRWPVFAVVVACLPLLATILEPNHPMLHFGVLANLCAVGLAASWRSFGDAAVIVGLAAFVVVVWVISDIDMAAPFGADIDLSYGGGRIAVLILYLVALVALLAFMRWFRKVVNGEEQRVRLLAREGAVTAQGAVVAERARLARDLHDVVAHHVSLIAVRAETAPYTEPDLEPAGRRVLAEVASEARLALDELRGVLGILGRADEGARSPQPTLADVAALVERAVRSGQQVHLDGDVHTAVAAPVGYAAYRVVQEALTNARKHAPGAVVDVTVAMTSDLLEVSVANPVADAASEIGGGRGLIGMRERVEALGGRLQVRAEGTRFEVSATLPTRTAHAD